MLDDDVRSIDSQKSDVSIFSIDAVMDMLPKLQTTKQVWRKPGLHRDRVIPAADFQTFFNSRRGETWYELFYDLVFVAASIQIGTIIKYNISAEGLFKAGIIFTVFRATWDQLMFYQNKFDTKDLVHYIYYLVQAMLVFVMSLHLTLDEHHKWDIDRNMTAISISAGISRIYAVIMYLQVMTITKNYRKHITAVALSQLFSGILFFLAPYLIVDESFYWFWLTSIAIERVLSHAYIALAIPAKERAPPHFGHLSHRQGTFILLVSGEAIIQLVQSSCGNGASDFARALMGFAIIFNVGDIYYQQQIVGRMIFGGTNAQPPTTLWTFLHLSLSLSLLYFAISIKMVYSIDCDDKSSHSRMIKDEFLMCTSCSISLIIIFFLRMTHKGIRYKGKKVRMYSYIFRFFCAFFCAFIPFMTHTAIGTIGILFFVTSLLIFQDLFSHRGHEARNSSGHKPDEIPIHHDHQNHNHNHNNHNYNYNPDSLTSERLAQLGMVIPTISGNSSSFFYTDDSFGRDEFLKKSLLVNPQQQQQRLSREYYDNHRSLSSEQRTRSLSGTDLEAVKEREKRHSNSNSLQNPLLP